ncbi:conserved hypothetical protein [Crocosphaera subtropica ATCC 51142]|uniref:Uncharacterized protein n=1 Tax=Crocosphaera subtropica (strain ATCC 51142 / BH68) TaxID=43989 RepID=B1X2H4_CROS5|nr:hypothetical protein [Crocosphaera subtropica]ACB54335.1 conserved hypothetical protein [Crocosphaera subtropica ATCC 51142]
MLGSFNEKKPKNKEENPENKSLKSLKGKLTKHQNLIGLWLFLLINVAGLGLVFALQLVQMVQIGRVANKPPATLVEKGDGTGLLTDAIPASQRTPRAIQRFTSDILTALFTVTPVLETQEGLTQGDGFDTGITIPRKEGNVNNRVTVNAYVASVAAIAPGFRDQFLSKLADITPPNSFNGTTQVLFKIDFLGNPIPVDGKSDEWTVTVVGTRYIIESQSGGSRRSPEPEPFKQVIYLKSVNPQFNPLPEISTNIQERVADITKIGLQITKMTPLDTTTPQGGDFLELPAQPQPQPTQPTEEE